MKITLEKDQKIYFTSDTHFHHSNICKGTTKWDDSRTYRPYETLSEMDNALVEAINSTVGENDILFHLGDWSFGGIEQIWEFRKQIKCKNIHLITGNHDHHILGNKQLMNLYADEETGEIREGDYNENYYEEYKFGMYWDNKIHTQDLFKSVSTYKFLTVSIPQGRVNGQQLKNKKIRLVLCHFPIASWHDMSKGVLHLHGHIHTPTEHKIGPGKMMDVGVDGSDGYKPYELREIMQLLAPQPVAGLLQHKFDHHN